MCELSCLGTVTREGCVTLVTSHFLRSYDFPQCLLVLRMSWVLQGRGQSSRCLSLEPCWMRFLSLSRPTRLLFEVFAGMLGQSLKETCVFSALLSNHVHRLTQRQAHNPCPLHFPVTCLWLAQASSLVQLYPRELAEPSSPYRLSLWKDLVS